MDPATLITAALFLSGPVFFVLWLRARRRIEKAVDQAQHIADGAKHRETKLVEEQQALVADFARFKAKYEPITSQEAAVEQLKKDIADLTTSLDRDRATYKEKRFRLVELEKQVAIYDDRMAFAELGVYEPHFEFTDSEQFKAEITKARERQKQLITDKQATVCTTDWEVSGSKAKGQTMINRQTRLTLRAFNAECDAAISNTRWNNVVAMEKRILNAADQINKENMSLTLKITDEYIQAKLEELRLTHEYRERQKAEKEERAELARAEREEKKLLAEAEAAEREERKFQALLDKAKAEADAATGGVTTAMAQRIAELEKALAEAHDASERARAMAEMTKSGYVYIISNVGSFGEDVVKIGLTRRLDPDDRVRELGDASVPFAFDIHAMIYSDEAPALENALHREFADRRINATNFRKEFFRVQLDEVEEAVRRLAPSASFFKDREAQEWHETLARRNQKLMDMALPSAKFPDVI